jgi:phenylacetate-CoA ligase
LVQLAATGDVGVGMSADEHAALVALTGRHLRALGVVPDDRVLVALNGDGVTCGSLVARAAAEVASAAVSFGPRGRMRLLRAIRSFRPTVLVATPTGATDLVARLHREFLVDPLELGIERVVLAGELTTEAVERQLGQELDAVVGSLLCDPWTGAGVAHVTTAGVLEHEGHLVVAPLDRDEEVEPAPGARYELVVRPTWSSALMDARLRTGYVVPGAGGGIGAPIGTVGDRVLVRGQWVSVHQLVAALRLIDGIQAWTFEVRRDGTLDVATLHVAFNRPSLEENPMWRSRLVESLDGIAAVDIEVVVDAACVGRPQIDDRRGHHVGVDRSGALAGPV